MKPVLATKRPSKFTDESKHAHRRAAAVEIPDVDSTIKTLACSFCNMKRLNDADVQSVWSMAWRHRNCALREFKPRMRALVLLARSLDQPTHTPRPRPNRQNYFRVFNG